MDAEGDEQGPAGGPAPTPGDDRLWDCARGIDAVQEAERVGSWHVDVQHLFSAALLDPVARRLFLEADGDLAAVTRWVGRPVRAGASSSGLGLPHAPAMTLTEPARSVVARLLERAADHPEVTRRCERGEWRDPRTRSTLRRWLLHDLVSAGHEVAGTRQATPGTEHVTDVPRLLDQLMAATRDPYGSAGQVQ